MKVLGIRAVGTDQEERYRGASLYLFPLVLIGMFYFEVTTVGAEELEVTEQGNKQPDQGRLNEKVVYTIEGKKDPRLQATFLASYISTSKSEACSNLNPTTATRKVKIGSKRYPVTEENYRIEIPIYLEENENECGYRFSRIELLLRRLYDDELYSRHILLDKTPKVKAIYYGTKTGFSNQASITTPAWIITDKRHFRIAKQTKYICRTKYYAYDGHSSFYCFMRIRNGKDGNMFIPTNERQTVVTHPEFGIDEIRSEVLQVDILADDQGSKANLGRENVNAQDYFRTLAKPKPESPQHKTMGERLKEWFYGLF